jgi:drug/metabolite transporter (DMT)-like permease
VLLITVGALLAAAVLLSKIAAEHGAPMLWYLTAAMGGSGAVLFATSPRPAPGEGHAPTLVYSLVAGGLMALGSALGYLSVERVGASFVALAMAFPTMMTYLLSLALGMDRFDPLRLAGVGAGLVGGLLLALGKGIGAAPSDIPALVMVCLMPVVLAIGNVYRSRFWPRGAAPRMLAGQMLLAGAALVLPVALWQHGFPGLSQLAAPFLAAVTLVAILSFALQYVAFFRLQQIAGPVYLSQVGSVAALIGAVVAMALLGERMPAGFAEASAFIVAGIAIFQYRSRNHD